MLVYLQEASNERLWFKTNLKLAGLSFDLKEFGRSQKILKELHKYLLNTPPPSLLDSTPIMRVSDGTRISDDPDLYCTTARIHSVKD